MKKLFFLTPLAPLFLIGCVETTPPVVVSQPAQPAATVVAPAQPTTVVAPNGTATTVTPSGSIVTTPR